MEEGIIAQKTGDVETHLEVMNVPVSEVKTVMEVSKYDWYAIITVDLYITIMV